MSGGSGQYEQMGFRGPKKNCDICGLFFYKDQLVINKGKWVCENCDDEEDE